MSFSQEDEIQNIKMVKMPLEKLINYTDNSYALTCAITTHAITLQKEAKFNRKEDEKPRYDHLQVSAEQLFDEKTPVNFDRNP